jgi:hypothetical protein
LWIRRAQVERTRARHRGEFVMQRDGRQVGELTYTIAGVRFTQIQRS